MKKSDIVKVKDGYVIIDTISLNNPIANMIDELGIGNSDAVAGEYETMVFKCNKSGEVDNWKDIDKANCSTEEEAKNEHKKMVKKWKDK